MEGILSLLLVGVVLGGCPATTPTVVEAPLVGAVDWQPVQQALAAGNGESALSLLDEAAADLPDDVESLLRGRALRAAKRPDEAAQAFARAATSADAALASDARLYGALLTIEQGDELRGLELLAQHPDEPGAWIDPADGPSLHAMRAEAMLGAADLDGALRAWAQAEALAREGGDQVMADFARERAFALPLGSVTEPTTDAPLLAHAVYSYQAALAAFAAEREEARQLAEEARALLAQVDASAQTRELELLAGLDTGGSASAIVGVVLPLTGESRRMGRAVLAGILQAQGAFGSGSAQRLTLVFRDSQGDAEKAAAAIDELEALGALAILGPLDVAESKRAAERAAEKGLPLLCFTMDASVTALGAYRFAPDFDTEIAHLAEHAYASGLRTALVLRADTSSAAKLGERFAERFEAAGGVVSAVETFDPSAVDLRELAKRLASKSFDALFLPAGLDESVRVASFLAQENVWSHGPLDPVAPRESRRFVSFLGTSLWQTDDVVSKASRYLDGALFPVSYFATEPSAANAVFNERFVSLYERSPSTYEAIAYDATRLLREIVVLDGATKRSAVADALAKSQDRVGATGAWSWLERAAAPQPRVLELRATGLGLHALPEVPAPETLPPASPSPTP